MREFFIRLVDARNVLALYKHLRWEMKDVPHFLRGGKVSSSRLRGIVAKGDVFQIIPLIRSLTGMTVKIPEPSAVENALYRGMTRFLRKTGREISGVGFILDYLWRCAVEAVNLGILSHGKDMERDSLRAELI
jgi:vacuolar-type H+-ATPase subunit C/Vma6